MSDADRDRTITLLAQVLSGLQAPLSLGIGMGILGAAEAPYRELLGSMSGFGWRNPAEFRAQLEGLLAPTLVTTELAKLADQMRSRFPDRDTPGLHDGYDAASGWLEAADYIDPRIPPGLTSTDARRD